MSTPKLKLNHEARIARLTGTSAEVSLDAEQMEHGREAVLTFMPALNKRKNPAGSTSKAIQANAAKIAEGMIVPESDTSTPGSAATSPASSRPASPKP